MNGLDDDDELHFEQHADDEDDGEDGQPHPYGTAKVLKCLLREPLRQREAYEGSDDGRR